MIAIHRHLSHCSTPDGHFCILAIDHRGVLREKMDALHGNPITDEAFTAFKLDVMAALLPDASGVLADPDFGFGPGIAQGVINGQVGLLGPLEITNYGIHPSLRDTVFIENWSPAAIKQYGGDGAKLLLYYHPEAGTAPAKRELVQQIIDDCAVANLPFFLEPVAFSPDPDVPLTGALLTKAVVETAHTFAQTDVNILKMQFPADADDEATWDTALSELDDACGDVPWTLLSAGVDYETFRKQAEHACAAGCSGLIVGRALWAEAVELDGDARTEFLTTTGAVRMRELREICKTGRSWRERIPVPNAAPGWYALKP